MRLRASPGCRVKVRAAASMAGPQAVEIPHQWYNLVADLPVKPPPALHPQTREPIKPEDLSPLFPYELIKQEASTDRFIAIPEEVIDVYRLWRPTPLIRFVHDSSLCRKFTFLNMRYYVGTLMLSDGSQSQEVGEAS